MARATPPDRPDRDGARRGRRAVIDVGSNSIRLVVFARAADGGWRRLAARSELVGLGGDLGSDGALSPARAARALATLRAFAAVCAAHGIPRDRIAAVATSAVRDAPDGAAFVARARRATGLPLRIISPREEAWYAYVAAVAHTSLRDGIVLDLGGGSLELVAVRDRRARALASWPLGAVRVSERFLPGDGPADPAALARLRAHAAAQLAGAPWVAEAGRRRLVGLGGTVRTLAAAAIRAAALERASVQGFVLAPDALAGLVARLAALPPSARHRVPGIRRGRAGVILGGAVVLEATLAATGAPGIEVVAAGLREGVLLARERDAAPLPPPDGRPAPARRVGA